MRRLLVLIVSLCILPAIILLACGDNNGSKTPSTASVTVTETTETPTITPTKTDSSISTTTPTISDPIKIGAITAWSGPMAIAGQLGDPVIKLVEWQVKQQGGLLGGREVKVVKYDNGGSTAETAAGCTKLYVDEKVSALVWGGVNSAQQNVVSTFAEEHHILYVQFGGVANASEKKYTLSGSSSTTTIADGIVNLFTKVLKPKTIAILASIMVDSHDRALIYKEGAESIGAKIVYEQYVEDTVSDFSSYLTKIKYDNPELLLLDFGPPEPFITIAKQVMELGGWGDIKVAGIQGMANAEKQAGAQGWYASLAWVPGLSCPGAVTFEQEFEQLIGRAPMSNHALYYNALCTAIHAIELAGTDTDLEKIAWTARFSGELEWDTPMGHAHYTAESLGHPGLPAVIIQVVNKAEVIVPVPE